MERLLAGTALLLTVACCLTPFSRIATPWYLAMGAPPIPWWWPLTLGALFALLPGACAAALVLAVCRGMQTGALDRLRPVALGGGAWILASGSALILAEAEGRRPLVFGCVALGSTLLLFVAWLDERLRRALRDAYEQQSSWLRVDAAGPEDGSALPPLLSDAPGEGVLWHIEPSAASPFRSSPTRRPLATVPAGARGIGPLARRRTIALGAGSTLLALVAGSVSAGGSLARFEIVQPDELALPASCSPRAERVLFVEVSRAGPSPSDAAVDVGALADRYRQAFALPVHVGPPLELPEEMVVERHGLARVPAAPILAMLQDRAGPAEVVVGVTGLDLVPAGTRWAWVFGQVAAENGAGVVSVARMGEGDRRLERLHKMVTRYVGTIWCRLRQRPYPRSILRRSFGSFAALDAMDERIW